MINRRNFLSQTLTIAASLLLSSYKKIEPLFSTSPSVANTLLGRISSNSACLNIYLNMDAEIVVLYGNNEQQLKLSTRSYNLTKNQPIEITLGGLKEHTRYYYQIHTREKGTSTMLSGGSFMTQRKKNSNFVFTVTADSHLGTAKHCDPALYQQTLENLAKDQPDLHFSMGDDFRTSKVHEPDYKKIEKLYYDQRHHLGSVFHSIPYYFILGNHELEAKAYDNGSNDCLSAWSSTARKKFIPNPVPDNFFSGNQDKDAQQNYYSFEWGDVLFVTLDVFRYSNFSAEDEEMKEKNKQNMEGLSKEERMAIRAEREKNKGEGKGEKGGGKQGKGGKDRWAFTIGDNQYRWLKETLENSKAKYKIVLAHHVMGSCRGGIECAHQFEWGGQSNKGINEFKSQRPNWEMPIHQLMVQHHVTAFIQGHDHLFSRQEKDGLTYITCPMSGDPGYNAYNANAYLSGDQLSNTGHLKFEVSKNDLRMQYVRSVLAKDEAAQGKNATVAYHWSFTKNSKI